MKRRSDCPISFTLDIVGDKWTLLILRDIMFYGRTRFTDFTPQERIATSMLANRLSKLERSGIIRKRRDETLKNQNVYSITKKGSDLLPTLIEMTLWGLRYDTHTPASNKFVARIKTARLQVADEVARAVKARAFTQYRQDHMGITRS